MGVPNHLLHLLTGMILQAPPPRRTQEIKVLFNKALLKETNGRL